MRTTLNNQTVSTSTLTRSFRKGLLTAALLTAASPSLAASSVEDETSSAGSAAVVTVHPAPLTKAEQHTARIKAVVAGINFGPEDRYLFADKLTLKRKIKGSSGYAYVTGGISTLAGTITTSLLGTGGDDQSTPILGFNRSDVEFTLGAGASATAFLTTAISGRKNTFATRLAAVEESLQKIYQVRGEALAAEFGEALTEMEKTTLRREIDTRLSAYALTGETWYGSALRTAFWYFANYRKAPQTT